MSKNRFVFLACSYNMSNTLPRLIHSIVGQSCENWRLCITDDVSDATHIEKSIGVIDKFLAFDPSLRDKVFFYGNTRKKWEVENILTMLRTDCEDDDIVCRIDADDYLTDLDALAIIDSVYQQTNCDVLWTAHRWGMTDQNISGPMPQNADPYKHPWVSSHLKTFRKHLLNGVSDQNYRGEDGNYVRRAGDQAIYLPALANAQKRIFLPRVMYHYTIKTDDPSIFQTDDAKFQKSEAEFLRSRGYVK